MEVNRGNKCQAHLTAERRGEEKRGEAMPHVGLGPDPP
jgi:hypothetical protein